MIDIEKKRSVKSYLHDLADSLPNNASIDDAMYKLYVKKKIDEGLKAVDEGRLISQDQVEKRLRKLISK